jgi:pre-mRNA-splicing factor SYF2
MDNEKDDDEIDLDDDDDEKECDDRDDNKQDESTAAAVAEDVNDSKQQDDAEHNDCKQDAPAPRAAPAAQPAQPAEQQPAALSKAAAMKQRLRTLKQKMNQARHLNQQAVKQEGERLGSHEAQNKEKRRLRAVDKHGAAQHLYANNSKAMQLAAEHNVPAKFLLQQASESVHKAQKRLESQERNQHSVNDTYNPEGQHRAYENSLKQLPRGAGGKQQHQSQSTERLQETFDPLQHQVAVAAASGRSASSDDRPFLSTQQERQGARRLAQEMQARLERNQKKEAEKKRKLERQEEAQHEDVGYINARNKRFNQKINRTYGKDTAEIKQNLERGTAL